jgi:hypothetical protein
MSAAIDIRLLPTEGIAFGNAALCRLDTGVWGATERPNNLI